MSVSWLILFVQIDTSPHPVFLVSYEQEENDCLRCASVRTGTGQPRYPPRCHGNHQISSNTVLVS